MRKALLILGLVAVTLLAVGDEAFAQRRGGGGGRGGGFGGRRGGGWYGGDIGFYGYGGRGYGYGYGYDPGYYDSSPGYYPDPAAQIPPTEYRRSFFSDPNSSTLTVLVPNGNAEVFFDDAPTTQRGWKRTFRTAPLQQAGTYTIRARWNDNGRNVDHQRQVRVQPGQAVVVDFRVSPSEKLPAPRPPE